MRASPMLLSVLAVAVGACGGGSATAPRAAHHPAPCDSRVSGAVGPHAAARVVDRSYGIVTCAYAAGGRRVRVTVDTLPQAQRRLANAEVETWQNTAGWAKYPKLQPRPKSGIGVSAYWVPGHRALFATDGKRLITVRVERPRGASAWPLARDAARAAVGVSAETSG